MVEQNESPRQGCEREVKEEIGLGINIDKMLCVDYISSTEEKDESLQFIFYGGILSSKQIKDIKLVVNELQEYKFINLQEVNKFFGPKLSKRIPHCISSINDKSCKYLENGDLVIS